MLFQSFNTICSIELRLKIIVRNQYQLKFISAQPEQVEMDNTEGDATRETRIGVMTSQEGGGVKEQGSAIET